VPGESQGGVLVGCDVGIDGLGVTRVKSRQCEQEGAGFEGGEGGEGSVGDGRLGRLGGRCLWSRSRG
jgi:hypothetical protein